MTLDRLKDNPSMWAACRDLRETSDILKAAASFFARELDPRNRPWSSSSSG
jgi:transposase